jgi:hypothetical protein
MTRAGHRVGTAVLCNHLEDETSLGLLQNGGPAVAREVASSLWSAEPKGQIPQLLQAAWRQAVTDHLAEDHEGEGIANKHPDLSCAGLKRRINQTYEERHRADSDFSANHSIPLIISALTKCIGAGFMDPRNRLIRRQISSNAINLSGDAEMGGGDF